MTLTEYNNQIDPRYMPHVILQDGEYTLGTTYNVYMRNPLREKQTQIWVKGYPYEYCLIGMTLYTTDQDGNPKQSSCFHLKI